MKELLEHLRRDFGYISSDPDYWDKVHRDLIIAMHMDIQKELRGFSSESDAEKYYKSLQDKW